MTGDQFRDYAVTTRKALADEIRAVLTLARNDPSADLDVLAARLLRDVGEIKAAEYEEERRGPYLNRRQREAARKEPA